MFIHILIFNGLTFLFSYLVTRFIMPLVIDMIKKAGYVRPNYMKEDIPVAVGFVFILVCILTIVIAGVFFNTFDYIDNINTFFFLFAITAMSFLGFIDDVLGNRNASGLMGHFKKLLREGELTTGALKALTGGFVAFIIALFVPEQGLPGIPTFWSNIVIVIINTLIIALSTNALNLLDLRPGRACKGFLLGALLLVFFSNSLNYVLFWALLGSVLAYLPHDLKARVMMGDAGSNVLGVTIGLMSVLTLDFSVKLIVLAVLIGFHIFTEKYSLTKVIENNRFLNAIDMLGRPRVRKISEK